ncbi:MAG TPA: DNA internalization-related competence protein ComEC/Rec2 [Desulfuromonadaceae bacterium]
MLRERPLLIPLAALAAGLAIGDAGGMLLPCSAVAAAFCCLLLSCLVRGRLVFGTATALFFLVWGAYALTPWKSPPASPCDVRQYAGAGPVIVEGVVQSRPVASAEGGSFVMGLEKVVREGVVVPACGNLMVSVTSGDISLARGDRVRLGTRIVLPRRLGLPGEFDYPRHLSFQGIAALGRVAAQDEIVLMQGAAEDSPLRRIDLAARRLGDFIRTSQQDIRISSVLAALLIGDQKRIPEDLGAAYTRAGVNHILSISGFHIAIIAFFIAQFGLLIATRSETLALRFNLRRLVLLFTLPAMALYLFLTGGAPATARSVIMLTAFVLALYAEREADPVNALLLSALVLLAINPPSLFDVSFQLSFLALWGIVIVVPPVMERLSAIGRGWLRTLLQFVATSCAASLATAVPVLFYFNQASLNGILSNFLIVPLLGYGAVLAGFCALPFVSLFPPMAHLLLWPAGKLVALSNWLIMLFARLPLLHCHAVTRLDMLAWLLFMAGLTFIPGRRLKTAFCLLPVSAAVLVHLAGSSPGDGRLHITMLSVGQGEALLIRTPDGGTTLVDGGGYLHENGRDFGERTLGPALFTLGVERIDRILLTHSHPDHLGGLPFVIRTLPVGEFLETARGGGGEEYQRLHTILRSRGVPVGHLSAGDRLDLGGGAVLTVLSPGSALRGVPSPVDEMGMNDESLVFRLAYGGFSMLFTGDAGFEAEKRIMASRADLTSVVLKVGHHGSRFSTSETFLGRVAPRAALISAGSGNGFGLPAPATLALLEKRGIRTYRTDRDGTIDVASDGRAWDISTPWRP